MCTPAFAYKEVYVALYFKKLYEVRKPSRFKGILGLIT